MEKQIVSPPLRWIGGKTRILSEIDSYLPSDFRDTQYKFVEPFLGSGTVLLYLLSKYEIKEAHVSDINQDLVNFFLHTQINPDGLYFEFNKIIKKFNKSISKGMYYYNTRLAFNECYNCKSERMSIENAARFLFLNRTSYNGIYRVNSGGGFNVPFGKKENVPDMDQSYLRDVSLLLKNVKITQGSFEKTLKAANVGKDTFVYLDPPYLTGHQNNGFVHYNETVFPWESQKKLRDLARSYSKKGAKVMISNADSRDIRALFEDDLFKFGSFQRKCCIGSQKSSRGDYSEIIITTY